SQRSTGSQGSASRARPEASRTATRPTCHHGTLAFWAASQAASSATRSAVGVVILLPKLRPVDRHRLRVNPSSVNDAGDGERTCVRDGTRRIVDRVPTRVGVIEEQDVLTRDGIGGRVLAGSRLT